MRGERESALIIIIIELKGLENGDRKEREDKREEKKIFLLDFVRCSDE